MHNSEDLFQQQTDFKAIFFKIFKYKYYFLLTVILALLLAFVINKITPNSYRNITSIMITNNSGSDFLAADGMMESLGVFSGNDDVENEIGFLKSRSVVAEAISDLNLEVSYHSSNYLRLFSFLPLRVKEELYVYSPISVVFDQTHVQPVSNEFVVNILSDSTFRIESHAKDVYLYDYINNLNTTKIDSLNISGVYYFGQSIFSDHFNFKVFLADVSNWRSYSNTDLLFKFNNMNYLTLAYLGSLSVEASSPTSSKVYVSFTGGHPQRITDFLNSITKVYLQRSLDKKNSMAFNTVKFIDSQIADISDSLNIAETRLQNFRSANKVMDLGFQGQKALEKMNELENERALIIIQQKYYTYIKEYFEKNSEMSELIAPSSYEVQDPTLIQLIGQLMELNNERNNLLLSNNEKNLFLRDIEQQITNIKNTILENIDYGYNKSIIALQDIDSRTQKLSGQISVMPKTQRELLGIERKFKLNDAIYTFLLQKKAEAQIARASNTPDSEIVDDAVIYNVSLIAPHRSVNYILAIIAGLVIPFLIVITIDFLNTKITEVKVVEDITGLPVLGHIHHNKTKSNAIIVDFPKSPIADSFRHVRTNLNFFAKGKKKLVLLITSSISGEGKSFSAVNIASVYALFGKKTCLLGFDLRRPGLFKDFGLNNDKGITSYLINDAKIENIIQHTSIENLDLIPSGPIPPNPVELIASDKTQDLINELKEIYDFIIIDTAPIGVVTDSLLLFQYADVNIFTMRLRYTKKDIFTSNLKSLESKDFTNVALLINDVKAGDGVYSYSYKSKYYTAENKGKGIRKFFKKKKS